MITKIAWRNIWRNRGRSLISIGAVFFCVFFAIVLRSMQTGSYENIVDDMVGSFNGYIQIHEKGFWDEQILDHSMALNAEDIAKIKSVQGVNKVVERLEGYSLVSSGNNAKVLGIFGINPANELSGLDLNKLLVNGTVFGKENGIVIAAGVAEYFKKSVGDTLILIGQGYHGLSANGLYPIVGIVKMRNPEMNKNMAFLNLATAQKLFGATNRVTSLVVQPKENVDHTKLASAIAKKLPQTYETMTYQEMMPELIQALQADSIGGLVMVFVLYMIIGFVLFGTIIMMTAERMKEFGILISVGMSRAKLIFVTVLENVFLSIIGGFLGLLLARPIQWYFHKNPIVLTGSMEKAMEEYGYEPLMPFSIDWTIGLTHTSIILCIALLVSIYAVYKISTLKPVEAMRN